MATGASISMARPYGFATPTQGEAGPMELPTPPARFPSMNRPISITIPHELGAAEARRRIDTGLGKLEKEVAGGLAQVRKHWEGDRMHFTARILGQAVSGRLEVLERAVQMEIELPPFLAMIADTIKGRLKKEGQLLLEKK